MESNQENYNNIQQWLDPLLIEKGWSIEDFARACGITKTAVYYYRADNIRPTETVMKRMCDVLGRPFEEGLKQYTPKKVGRPRFRDSK